MTQDATPATPSHADPTHGRAWHRLTMIEPNGRRYLLRWRRAVELQARRVLDREGSFDDREIDAWQLCIAARQVRRAADMIIRVLGSGSDLLDSFDRAAPGVVDARDAIDHFDDYARGVGNLAHPGLRPAKRQPTEDAARRFEPRYSEVEGRSVVMMGEATVDIAATAVAVDELVQSLLHVAGFVEMTDSPGLPPFDFTEPHGYAVMLSYVSCNRRVRGGLQHVP